MKQPSATPPFDGVVAVCFDLAACGEMGFTSEIDHLWIRVVSGLTDSEWRDLLWVS
jgi:hypothetical protein